MPAGYHPLNVMSLPRYLSQNLPSDYWPDGPIDNWQVEEVGDGNLNLVFIVRGLTKALVVKQALPYVRAAGESWPMSLQRSYFEYHALSQQRRFATGWVPQVYFYDPIMALFVMEYLSDHLILRKGLIAGIIYPNLADDMGHFLANNLFYTSDLGMPPEEKKTLVARFAANTELCRITEDLIFTEPYYNAARNNWHRPALDGNVFTLWQDELVIQIAMRYKWKFMTETQALLHGDLHTGSVMVNQHESKVIDPEFAFYGPMAFDIGNYLANLLMAYFSQPAHRQDSDSCQYYQQWLLEQLVSTWQIFERQFRLLWDNKRQQQASDSGQAWPIELYPNDPLADLRHLRAQSGFFSQLFCDTLVNAGLEMNRRVIGFAGVADLQSIADGELRAKCERKVLAMARQLIVTAAQYQSINDVVMQAQALAQQ